MIRDITFIVVTILLVVAICIVKIDIDKMKTQLNKFFEATTVVSSQGKICLDKSKIMYTELIDYIPMILNKDASIEQIDNYLNKIKPFQIN